MIQLRQFITRYFDEMYVFINSVGLIYLVYGTTTSVGRVLLDDRITVLNWIAPFYFPDKRYVLFGYLTTAFILFCYYILFFLKSSKKHKYPISTASSILFSSAISNYIIVDCFTYNASNTIIVVLDIIIWLMFSVLPRKHDYLLSPEYLRKISQSFISRWNGSFLKSIYIFIFLTLILQFGSIFVPLIYNVPQIKNEYLAIPEKTVIGGKELDNHQFISKYKLLGNKEKYSITHNESSPYFRGGVVFDDLTKDSSSNITKDREREFVEANKIELEQIFYDTVLIFHHHNHLMAPINEYRLGKNINDIFFIYGWLPTLTIMHAMEIIGGINYQTYFKIIFSFYPLYYTLLIILSWMLLKRLDYVLFITIFSFGAINALGYLPILAAPGFAPFRHFFDVFVMASFYLFLSSRKLRYLTMSLLFALIATVNDSNFGIFIFTSLIIVVFIRFISLDRIEKSNIIELLLVLTFFIIAAWIRVWGQVGKDLIGNYFISGLLAWPLKVNNLYHIFLIISLSYILLFRTYLSKNKYKLMALLLLIYSQCIMLYWVLMSEPWHFLSITPILVLTMAMVIKVMLQWRPLRKYENTLLCCLCVIGLVSFYLPSVIEFYLQKNDYDAIFKKHAVYDWGFERAKIKSTMEPRFFEDGIKLIQAYEKNEKVYMISKYDNLLPILANKYSAMPFIEVAAFIFTDKEKNNCIDTLMTDLPRYLFVDTDIERRLVNDIVDKDAPYFGYLNERSAMRVQRLNNLSEIFNKVKNKYRPVEQGLLITVYERI